MKIIGIIGAAALAVAIAGFACSSHKRSTDPKPVVISMQGAVTLPDESQLAYSELEIGFGAHDSVVENSGSFAIEGNEHTPGLAIVSLRSGSPILMAIVPNPASNLEFQVDVHSTAVALVFLHPFICTNNPEFIDGVLADIENLPELAMLEEALAASLTEQTLTLDVEDWEINYYLEEAVFAYVDGFNATRQNSRVMPGPSLAGIQAQGIEIDPSSQRGGLQLKFKGGDQFELTNTLGRWAYCTTPEDSFYVFPNGDFLDLLKGTRPWAPTTKTFHMTVPPNADAQEVHVYGYGFAETPENSWDSLSHDEEKLANVGGIPTVLIELCSPLLSIVTNTSVTIGREEIAKRIGGTVVGLILSQGTLMQQLALYAKGNDPWGLSWTLSKWVMNELVTNTQFRNAFISATGMALTSVSLDKLARWLSMPAKAVMTFNSVSSTLKTAFGFTNAEFNTTFEVWQDELSTGTVRGQIADSITGSPIQGAVVDLEGDDDNPLEPTHRVTTGAEGTYYFANITTGPKSITASKAGYAPKTIQVTVEKDREITEHITLARQSGGVTGRILDGLLVHHGINPANFKETIQLQMRPVGGGSASYQYVSNGSYALSLSSGTWWLKADYEGYSPDSVQVNVSASGTAVSPRDLVLQPRPTMEGNIYLDMNNDGTNDQTIPISFPGVGLSAPVVIPCDPGTGEYFMMVGVRGSSNSNFDAIRMGFKVQSIPDAEAVEVGPFMNWPCSPQSGRAIAFFSTTRQRCTAPGESAPLTFTFEGNPEKPGCACGITNPGQVFLTEWGTQIGDVVAGGITADLHGWVSCYCDARDTDFDGINDQYDVECARAHVVIDFRVQVGSDYLVPWAPSAPPIPHGDGGSVAGH